MCTTVRLSVLMFVSVLVCVTVGQNDQTLSPGARGAGVVEAVCSRLEASCAFSEDKLFTRRLAYVESYDGEHPDAFRPGYHGGIWQVDKAFFDLTVNPSVLQTLSQTIQKIKLSFGITWSTVKWEDLQKPLYSAIAARLYLQYKARAVTSGIPRSINEQATYWRTYYRPAGDTNKFVQDSNRLEKVCSSANGADIVFILDESGSVGSSNYLKVKSFVKDIVQSFDVGLAPHQTRFAVTTFSTSVYRRFDLNDYTTKSALLTAIDRIPYSGGSTYTDLALDELSKNSFTAARGARPREAGHPRVGIVVTDGRSTQPTRTLAAAKRVHDADIIVFAVGVGSSLNYQELEAIASKPVCLHQMLLNNFQEFESLKYIIQKRTCEAPIIITDNSTDVRPPPDGQNCQIKVPPSGTTVRVKSEEGSVTFFVASSTYPSNDYFEHKVVARPGRLGVLYVTKLNTSGGNDTMFCNIKGDNSSSNASIDGKPGDHDKCRHKECLNEGECVQDDTGKSWCECHPPYTGDKCQIEITTTTTTTTTTTPTTTTPTTTTPTTTTSTTTTPTTTTSTTTTPTTTTSTTTPTTTTSTTTTTAPTTTTQSSQGGYNCDTNDPCTTGLISGGQFYFPHNDPSKFVQCSEWGQCYEMSCPSGLVWDTSALTCIPSGESNPETTTTTAPTTTTTQSSQGGYNCYTNNPCTPEHTSGGHFYFPHNDPSKFVQCSEWGQCYEMLCPSGLVWDTGALTCVVRTTVSVVQTTNITTPGVPDK